MKHFLCHGSQLVYQTLLRSPIALSAKQLAVLLHEYPTTVYRLVEPLIQMGLVTKSGWYPVGFQACPADEALSKFLLYQNDLFSKKFCRPIKSDISDNKKQIPASQQIHLLFIQSRNELMNLSVGETDRARTSIDLLRSGGEIPPDLMLSLIESMKRNVRVRMLIQDYSSKNANTVAYWIKNGIQVRKSMLRHVRLMLYDSNITYFMSYRHIDSEKDLGMKIDYPPFAVMLSQLFNIWWEKADEIVKAS